jgi:hypothetical protein
MDVVAWLRSLGLGKYEAAFRGNDIDETVLPNLTTRSSFRSSAVRSPISGPSSPTKASSGSLRAK